MMYIREIIADIREARKDDKGAGFVEYGAIILLVAGIVAAVWTLDVPDTIATMIEDAVGSVETEAEAEPGGGGDDEGGDDEGGDEGGDE